MTKGNDVRLVWTPVSAERERLKKRKITMMMKMV